ncbi:YozQ family protein [Paenibacillus andongensis]|uniref:YozQ family protein n=1 Tax=Paenibacillus andongensis TaxID=2975482 RepID=UPI0021BACEE8|nr:YozQ family protein [Paenibacillus andongensis]
MKKDKDSYDKKLEGSSLTHEQISDVYAAGTSDGIHQLADGEVKITDEPFESGQK